MVSSEREEFSQAGSWAASGGMSGGRSAEAEYSSALSSMICCSVGEIASGDPAKARGADSTGRKVSRRAASTGRRAPQLPQNRFWFRFSWPQVAHTRDDPLARKKAVSPSSARISVPTGAPSRCAASSADSNSRSSSTTACSRFSGGFVKYTSAQRPMCAARTGLSNGFSSGRGNVLWFGLSGSGTRSPEAVIFNYCTTGQVRLSIQPGTPR